MAEKTVREQLAEALEAISIEPKEDGIWLELRGEDGRSASLRLGTGGPGPIVTSVIVGCQRARNIALARHRAEPKTHHREDLLVALDELFQGFQKSPDAQGHDDYWDIDPDAWKAAKEAYKAAISELQCPDGCDTSCRCYQQGLEAQRERVG